MDDEDVARAIALALDGRAVATAESCTAGRLVAALAAVEGATDFLRGGLVSYQETVKRAMLGVTAPSVFSTRAAIQMAVGACSLLRAEVAVATTGVVGGDAVDGVVPGTVFVGTCVDGDARAIEHRFRGSPEAICDAARRRALLDLLDHLRASSTATSRSRWLPRADVPNPSRRRAGRG
jgi:nicotinamide-nucleotide amidase